MCPARSDNSQDGSDRPALHDLRLEQKIAKGQRNSWRFLRGRSAELAASLRELLFGSSVRAPRMSSEPYVRIRMAHRIDIAEISELPFARLCWIIPFDLAVSQRFAGPRLRQE